MGKFQKYSIFLKIFKNTQDYSSSYSTFHRYSEYTQVFENNFKYTQVFENNFKYTQVFENNSKYTQVFLIIPNILKELIKSIPRSESGDKCL